MDGKSNWLVSVALSNAHLGNLISQIGSDGPLLDGDGSLFRWIRWDSTKYFLLFMHDLFFLVILSSVWNISWLSCIYTGDCYITRNGFCYLGESLGMSYSQFGMLFVHLSVQATLISWPVHSRSCLGKLQGLSTIPNWRGPIYKLPCCKGRCKFSWLPCCAGRWTVPGLCWELVNWCAGYAHRHSPDTWDSNYRKHLNVFLFFSLFLHNYKFSSPCHNIEYIGLDCNLIIKSR